MGCGGGVVGQLQDVERLRKEVKQAGERESAMERRFMELDVFKLDAIASALKAVDEVRQPRSCCVCGWWHR